jgi:hypothetical protein
MAQSRQAVPFLADDSPIRLPPDGLSRRQLLVLDGLRFAVEMAVLAYERLAEDLTTIAGMRGSPNTRAIASAMMDAWSIIDAVHRFNDMLADLPGLPNAIWRRQFEGRVEEALELRDCVQHQLGELEHLETSRGPIWGFLSWAEVGPRGEHTGKWVMISPGSVFVGDKWLFMGPIQPPFPVPIGFFRLNAFGRQVYLGRVVVAVREAAIALAADISAGHLRAIGEPAQGSRDPERVTEGWISVVYEVPPGSSPDSALAGPDTQVD